MKVHLEQPLVGFSWTLVMVLITFVVLYFVLKKFLFTRVHDYMLAREQKIIDAFENAADVNRAAEERLNEYNAKLEDIAKERREMLSAAKLKADEFAQLTVQDAEKKAAGLLHSARDEITREKERAIQDMREQVSMLAVYAAEKIIEQKLDAPAQQAIVDGVIDQTLKGTSEGHPSGAGASAGKAEWKI
ncbi:MAG: F0F1 ATP synthase subunit B [Clostridiales Family XIII bacterium]|jgi:F-type H+-transporting ATPase subunit b|nr:F0F1 ATP synthase subunit B [Clostridiales Family XIII bacterium]